jgi:HEAT repeat protein
MKSIKINLALILAVVFLTINMTAQKADNQAKTYRSGEKSAQNKYGSPAQNDRRPDGMPYGILNNKKFSNLLDKLRFGTPKQKSEAALTFGRAREKRATHHLVHELRDNKPHIMASIAEALGMIRDKRAVPALILWLKKLERTYKIKTHTKYNSFLVQAVYALGKIGDKRAVPILVKCLKAKYRRIREAAVTSLVWLKAYNAIRNLRIAAFTEKIYHVKRKMQRAIRILSKGN